ncbi:hypothetical protein ACFR9U_12810 [Halorientalis brevis]|uniref:RecA-superfamily ATPase, KaiC/GvpD/RAD55 family n=1 Tax=Halorientalis brevis TaxID=1126241 RepID=A0ABD6CDD9_9EURY|nr:hypothetical protein [Halorientalis brevis]
MAEPVASRETNSLSERLRGAANILVMEPSFGTSTSGVCLDLLAGEDPPSATVLGISYRQSPAEWIDDWQAHVGTAPAHGMVISVGDRADPRFSSDGSPDAGDRWSVSVIENASDLTGLGIELSEFLEYAYEADAVDRPRLCFDSLTALLQYADLKRAFRFLHVVTGRVKSAHGVGHYHLDPDAHDEQTLATIKGLFDAVVEVDETGEWSVKTR